MSRIHEALKKAEQERLAAGGEETVTSPAETALPIPAVRPQETPGSDGSLTLEKVMAHSAQARWSPEPKTALLLDGNQTHGTEELRTLRSRLYQIRDRQPLQTILVTSALPAEGKTFLTANLAHMIVRQHERCALIIDADLRRSQLHLALGAPVAPGLTEYLRGEADELSIIQRGAHDLFFIPGGKPVANPAELLANGRMKTLLDRVAPVFDWVLLDSPPAVLVSDASLLADLCDGVLMVIRAGITPFDMAQRAREEFRNKRMLGVVLNRMEPGETYHSYYYHYYGNNSKNKKKGQGS